MVGLSKNASLVLAFCKADIFYYCNEQKSSTTSSDSFFAEGRRYDSYALRFLRLPSLWAQIDTATSNGFRNALRIDLIPTWNEVVQLYTATEVTYDGDRMTALSALARQFSRISGCAASSYAAGLWNQKGYLHRQLLWRSDRKPYDDQPSKMYSNIPSWSSLRHRARVLFDQHPSDADPSWRFEVLEMSTTLQKSDLPFRAVQAGKLVIKAALFFRLTYQPTERPLLWTRDGGFEEPYATSQHPLSQRYLVVLRDGGLDSASTPLHRGYGLVLEKTGRAQGQYVRIARSQSEDCVH